MKYMAKPRKKRSIDLFFVLMLFCVFSVISLMLVSIGAKSYQRTADAMDKNYQTRTSLSYVANKVRATGSDGVRLVSMGGTDVLTLSEQIDNQQYQTMIYYQDGALYELFVPQGTHTSLEQASEIMQVDHFSYRIEGNLLILTSSPKDGAAQSLTLFLEGVQP